MGPAQRFNLFCHLRLFHYVQPCYPFAFSISFSALLLQILQMFNHLGICKGVVGTRTAVDGIRKQHDSKMSKWKRDVARTMDITKYNLRRRSRTQTNEGSPESNNFVKVIIIACSCL